MVLVWLLQDGGLPSVDGACRISYGMADDMMPWGFLTSFEALTMLVAGLTWTFSSPSPQAGRMRG
jgi:hypothetical protein